MSSITILPNRSGTGKVTLVAPVTNTNQTLTLPDNNGTVLSSSDLTTTTAAAEGLDNSTLMTPLAMAQSVNTFCGFPTGAVIYVAANAAPSGYMKANGAVVSRSTYSRLFAAIGTTYGAGDGSTTFSLPDLRGEFQRGLDDGRGVDGGRSIGTAQAQDIQSHDHGVYSTAGPINTGNGSIPHGRSTETMYKYNNLTTTSTGGTETRPRNTAMLACIRF